jgi:hypothetical protein
VKKKEQEMKRRRKLMNIRIQEFEEDRRIKIGRKKQK